MNYVKLGRTGLRVSPLCLGTMNFGPRTSEGDSHALMSEALAQGINFWDTADVYGGKSHEGITEQILGRWFEQNAAKRDQVVLATKYQGGMGTGANLVCPAPRRHASRSAQTSLTKSTNARTRADGRDPRR